MYRRCKRSCGADSACRSACLRSLTWASRRCGSRVRRAPPTRPPRVLTRPHSADEGRGPGPHAYPPVCAAANAPRRRASGTTSTTHTTSARSNRRAARARSTGLRTSCAPRLRLRTRTASSRTSTPCSTTSLARTRSSGSLRARSTRTTGRGTRRTRMRLRWVACAAVRCVRVLRAREYRGGRSLRFLVAVIRSV
jgi:hypothetical protein